RGHSPWVLDGRHATLRQETDRGWANAAVESRALSRANADAWLAARDREDAITIVGHEDILALPPG
ncbi:MAG: SAM-dependent methyltransferase, partial [Alphaproteobacteria bacterium]|nr:SAM-dependent methyltransferase [Alphaproteobacteria bacterium]